MKLQTSLPSCQVSTKYSVLTVLKVQLEKKFIIITNWKNMNKMNKNRKIRTEQKRIEKNRRKTRRTVSHHLPLARAQTFPVEQVGLFERPLQEID